MTNLGKRSKAALVARPLDYQEVRLKAAPVWSQAVVWTIIGTASLGFIYAVTAKIDEVVVANGTNSGPGRSPADHEPRPGGGEPDLRQRGPVGAGWRTAAAL